MRNQVVKTWKWKKGGHSEESKKLIASRILNRSKEWTENMSKAQLRRYSDPIVRKRHSELIKKNWKKWRTSPEGKAQLENVAKCKQSNKERVKKNHHTRVMNGKLNSNHELRELLIPRYGNVCWYCGLDLETLPQDPWERTHVDHIIPHSKGGTDHISNRALSCPMCNRAKHNYTLDYFFRWLAYIRSSSFKSALGAPFLEEKSKEGLL